MAGTTSVSGLVSGLDTSTIVSQLMQVEAQTQTRLKGQLTTEQSTVSSLQDLNASLKSLVTSATDLAKAASWNPLSITSSSDLVAVSGGTGTTAGPLSFTVVQTARAYQQAFTTTALPTDVVTGGSTSVLLTGPDGTPRTLDTGDGTLAGLVSALNASGTGVRATTVRIDATGTERLVVTSATTGAASTFSLTALDGSPLLGGATATAGQDAKITIGTDTVSSATNTFADVTNGLTVTLKNGVPAGTVVDVDVKQDVDAMGGKIKGFVDAVNAVLAKIDKLTAYDATTKSSGPLAGDATVRSIRNALLSAVYPTDGTSMASTGLQLDRSGKLVFDQDAFEKAYAANPVAVNAAYAPATGFLGRVQAVADGASDPVDGTLTSALQSRNDQIKRLQDSIADWDQRLQLRQESLTQQFTAMETMLSQLNSQQSWLSGQLASLSK